MRPTGDDPEQTWPGLTVASVPPGPQDTMPAPPPALDSDEPTWPGHALGRRRQSERSMRAIEATQLAELQALADAAKAAVVPPPLLDCEVGSGDGASAGPATHSDDSAQGDAGGQAS